ncbi:hypothetical protein HZA98_02930 [Candidatus Woesearchaeota archaeon]|nr:hypothetical protein [Candidatus Woesearchaeota archaeon]
MQKKQRNIIVLILLCGAIIFALQNLNSIGYAILNPEDIISLSLDTDTFAVASPITGMLTLTFNNDISPSTPISFTLNELTQTFTLTQLLEITNHSKETLGMENTATAEEAMKKIKFENAGSKLIGVKVPRYAEVSKIKFNLFASQNNGEYPTALTIDIGNEGTIDWLYLGSFTQYNLTKITGKDLDTSKEGTGYIQDNTTYYCELMNIPKTKQLRITADYTKIGNAGNIKAVLLSVPSGNPKIGWTGGSNTCDLPEAGDKFCDINVDYTIEGNYLACIYSTEQANPVTKLYETPLDTSDTTQTAFTCPTMQDSICQTTGFSDFYIYAQPGVYNNQLQGNISTTLWETSPDAMLTAVKYYVGSEPFNGICKTDNCIVPINITSANAGYLNFSALNLEYTYNGVAQQTSTFFDIESREANITSIDGKKLIEGAAIDIAIERLNLTEEAIGDYTLTINFLNESAEKEFSIKSSVEVLNAQELISEANTRLSNFLTSSSEENKILTMLDKGQTVKQTLEDLNKLKDQIGFTDEATLLKEVKKILEQTPWEIIKKNTKNEYLTIESTDIPQNLGDILDQQTAITVKGTSRTIIVKNYNGEESSYTLIHKQITANEDLSSAKIYEEAPTAWTNILYAARPTSISGNEAVYELSLKQGETQDYYYLSTSPVNLEDFKTIILPGKAAAECGNNICEDTETTTSCPADCTSSSSFPWGTVIIVIIIIGVILLSLYLYTNQKHKKTFDPITKSIQTLKTKGYNKEQIFQAFQRKGWAEKEINNAIKKAGL